MENKEREVVISEARESYNRVRQIREKSPNDREEREMLVRDLEKVFGLDDIFEKFSSQNKNGGEESETIINTQPTNSIEFFAKSENQLYSSRNHAQGNLRKVLELSPNHYEAMSKLDKTFSEKVVKIAPNFAKGYTNRAHFRTTDHQRIQDYDKARALLEVMSPVPAELAKVYFGRGRTNYYLQNYDHAIRDFTYTINATNGNYSFTALVCLTFRARCYLAKERFELAILDLSEMVPHVGSFATSLRDSVVKKLRDKIMKL